jgi:hypothetical protein
VYTDANENGVEDDPILSEDGTYTASLASSPDTPAVALLNPANEVTQFVTTGEGFEAVNGPARGQTAIPIDEATAETGLAVAAIEDGDLGLSVTVEGNPGLDMSNWRAIAYDGITGEVSGSSTYLSDTIQLSPRISETAKITLDKILETVFLALVATTAGLFLAIPLSFVAARNIMRDISITVTNFVLTLIFLPAGAVAGVIASRLARNVVDPVGDERPDPFRRPRRGPRSGLVPGASGGTAGRGGDPHPPGPDQAGSPARHRRCRRVDRPPLPVPTLPGSRGFDDLQPGHVRLHRVILHLGG